MICLPVVRPANHNSFSYKGKVTINMSNLHVTISNTHINIHTGYTIVKTLFGHILIMKNVQLLMLAYHCNKFEHL